MSVYECLPACRVGIRCVGEFLDTGAQPASHWVLGVRPTRAEIDLGAIVHNAAQIQAHVGTGVRLVAVIKADGYGHGAVEVARTLAAEGRVAALAVSLVEEGLELRETGVRAPILVLGCNYDGFHAQVVRAGLTPLVCRAEDVHAFARAAGAQPVDVHLKIDTGMSRLGVRWDELPEFLDAVTPWSGITWQGVCTHLAQAEGPDDTVNRLQMSRFAGALDLLRSQGITPPWVHSANSYGVARVPMTHGTAVRPGIALFGAGPRDALSLRPAMRLVTHVTHFQNLQPGDRVSYGGLFTAQRPTRVAILPVGYADGYPRRLTGRAQVLVGGRRAPVLGAICMDMIMVDVTDVPGVDRGAEAVLLGQQGAEEITVAELAERAGTIEWEILCEISKRVPRVHLGP